MKEKVLFEKEYPDIPMNNKMQKTYNEVHSDNKSLVEIAELFTKDYLKVKPIFVDDEEIKRELFVKEATRLSESNEYSLKIVQQGRTVKALFKVVAIFDLASFSALFAWSDRAMVFAADDVPCRLYLECVLDPPTIETE